MTLAEAELRDAYPLQIGGDRLTASDGGAMDAVAP